MNKFTLLLFLCLIVGCSNKISHNSTNNYTVIGQVYIHYFGGEPPNTENYTRLIRNNNCLRFYEKHNFDHDTPYQEISTNDLGFYEIKTTNPSCALVLINCANGVKIMDTLKKINYEKIHLINFMEELNDTIYFIDTLWYSLPQ